MQAQLRASQGLLGREELRIWSSSSFELGGGLQSEGGRSSVRAQPRASRG